MQDQIDIHTRPRINLQHIRYQFTVELLLLVLIDRNSTGVPFRETAENLTEANLLVRYPALDMLPEPFGAHQVPSATVFSSVPILLEVKECRALQVTGLIHYDYRVRQHAQV